MGVITISREMGSAGSYIGKVLAEQLDLVYVDKQYIAMIMREYGFSQFDEVYDNKPNFWERFDTQRIRTVDFLVQTIGAIGKVGDVVIVGRGGFGILSGYADVLHVRLKAPFALRIRRQMKEHSLSYEDAIIHVQENDTIRHTFMASDLHLESNDTTAFDLVLDTGVIEPDHAAQWIGEAYRYLMKHGRPGVERKVDSIKRDPILVDHVREMLEN